ncbi:EamA family transporter RarD [Pseudonocardia sp. CA-107938]|uniref:EamA family transporter RarD n=1 Tax=Pseudonocardia sp. CA-107938 TaxID=3240021 RepID=UPI003D933209
MATQRTSTALDGRAVAAAVTAYAMWGLFPAFWALMAPSAPVEVLAHRIAWTAVLMVVVLSVVRGWRDVRAMSARSWAMTSAAGLLIAVNWGLYIYAVFVGHVVEAALGYFMSPLVNVLLGVVVLHERLRPVQWAAVALALVAVTVIAVENGAPPWIALGLATSFGVYGLVKRTVPMDAVPGFTAESLALAPIAVAVAVGFEVSGAGTFTALGVGHALLLVVGGPVTAVPLLLYAAAARRVPLTVLGVLLYINPILQFLWGVLVMGEVMPPGRWVGFVLVWVALAVFTVDLLRGARRPR